MTENKKAAPGVDAPGSGMGYGYLAESIIPLIDYTTLPVWKQARVAPLLRYGKEAAITTKELKRLLDAGSSRVISAAVEMERAAGIPICASTNRDRPGLFLPATTAELTEYRRSLHHRVAAVVRALEAVENVHDGLIGQQRIDLEEKQ